jgi:protein-S-isoprenylcysteine O-methyltransferase Ste14
LRLRRAAGVLRIHHSRAHARCFTVSVGFGVARLAKREDRPVLAEFGETYMRYARTVPAFISRGRRPQTSVA